MLTDRLLLRGKNPLNSNSSLRGDLSSCCFEPRDTPLLAPERKNVETNKEIERERERESEIVRERELYNEIEGNGKTVRCTDCGILLCDCFAAFLTKPTVMHSTRVPNHSYSESLSKEAVHNR